MEWSIVKSIVDTWGGRPVDITQDQGSWEILSVMNNGAANVMAVIAPQIIAQHPDFAVENCSALELRVLSGDLGLAQFIGEIETEDGQSGTIVQAFVGPLISPGDMSALIGNLFGSE